MIKYHKSHITFTLCFVQLALTIYIVRNSGSFPHHIGIFYGQDSSKGWWINTTSDGNFHIGAENLVSNEGSIVIQDSTGNVGIGTTNPDAQLHIEGPGHKIRLTDEDGNTGKIDLSSGHLYIASNDSRTDLFVGSTGNVGIGTTSPGASLDIMGGLRVGNGAAYEQFIIDSTGIARMTRQTGGYNLIIENTSTQSTFDYGAALFKADYVYAIKAIGKSYFDGRLQVANGDVYMDNSAMGLILKSPSGDCFRVTIDDLGDFIKTPLTSCP